MMQEPGVQTANARVKSQTAPLLAPLGRDKQQKAAITLSHSHSLADNPRWNLATGDAILNNLSRLRHDQSSKVGPCTRRSPSMQYIMFGFLLHFYKNADLSDKKWSTSCLAYWINCYQPSDLLCACDCDRFRRWPKRFVRILGQNPWIKGMTETPFNLM